MPQDRIPGRKAPRGDEPLAPPRPETQQPAPDPNQRHEEYAARDPAEHCGRPEDNPINKPFPDPAARPGQPASLDQEHPKPGDPL